MPAFPFRKNFNYTTMEHIRLIPGSQYSAKLVELKLNEIVDKFNQLEKDYKQLDDKFTKLALLTNNHHLIDNDKHIYT